MMFIFFTNDPADEDVAIDILTGSATDLNLYKVSTNIDPNIGPISKYEKLLSALTGRERRSLLGIVSIKIDTLFVGREVKDPPTEFKIVLKNRKTIWVYLNQEDGSEESRTGTEQPFMHKGNITPRDKNDSTIPYRMATPSDAFAYQTKNGPIHTQVYIYKIEEVVGAK